MSVGRAVVRVLDVHSAVRYREHLCTPEHAHPSIIFRACVSMEYLPLVVKTHLMELSRSCRSAALKQDFSSSTCQTRPSHPGNSTHLLPVSLPPSRLLPLTLLLPNWSFHAKTLCPSSPAELWFQATCFRSCAIYCLVEFECLIQPAAFL